MNAPGTTSDIAEPTELCGYPVDAALNPGQTYLAIGPGGRGIVLKKMDPDCLLRGLLHPSIRDRLCRVRELAHAGVANLHGVGRDGENAWLIWEYLEGVTFEQRVHGPLTAPRDLPVIARELILSVDSLHMQGIVHGAISAGNVIIGRDNSVRLTHVSPLLYTDMSVDVEAVIALLRQAVERRGEQGSALGQLLAQASSHTTPLRALSAKIAALLEARDDPTQPEVQVEELHQRRRILVGALAITLMGLAAGYAVWRAVDGGPDLHTVLRWLPNTPSTK